MTWIFKPCTRDLFGSYYLCIKLTYVYICIKCTFTKFWGRCQNEGRTFYRCIINHICSVCRTFNRSTFSGDGFIISTYITNHLGQNQEGEAQSIRHVATIPTAESGDPPRVLKREEINSEGIVVTIMFSCIILYLALRYRMMYSLV